MKGGPQNSPSVDVSPRKLTPRFLRGHFAGPLENEGLFRGEGGFFFGVISWYILKLLVVILFYRLKFPKFPAKW